MRAGFHTDLDLLTTDLQQMCRSARTGLATATIALLTADLVQAEQALDVCRRVEIGGECCESAAVALLGSPVPVASELRRVVGAVQLVGDLARMGALAGHIAEITRRRHPEPAVPAPVHSIVARMGATATAMATITSEVLGNHDADTAAALDRQDDVMDGLHDELMATILAPDWPATVAHAVDLTLIARYYQRFADHTVNVGLRILFVATGEYPTRER